MQKRYRTAETTTQALRILWEEGFFKDWSDQKKILLELSKRGNNFPINVLRVSLSRAKHLTRRSRNGASEYIQKRPPHSEEIKVISADLFEETLIKKLGKSFSQEIQDLYFNFGKSGNCTAFLLRKILEKLIYICFARIGMETKLQDKGKPGRLIGLEAMINAATSEKVQGIPLLTSKTAQEIRGVKFLGDTSAHNALVDVDMKTIIPQLPFIVTAYKELASFL